MNNIVRKHGKQSIVWSGFQKANAVKIPNNILVMEYETSNYPPQNLIDEGYRIINATFKPLYLVNNQRWDPAYIYKNWNPFIWEMPGNIPGTGGGIKIDSTSQVVGGSMSSWEQTERKEIPSLRRRLAAMSARLWNPQKRDTILFLTDLDQTDEKFGRLLSPVEISETGRTYPGSYDGNRDEKFWFDSVIVIKMKSVLPGITMHYTLDGSYPDQGSAQYKVPLSFNKDVQLRVQAYTQEKPVGFTINNNYWLHPISAHVRGLRKRKDTMPGSWEKAKFDDSVLVAFSSKIKDSIRYTIRYDGTSSTSTAYMSPLIINQSATITARIYDTAGKAIGHPFNQEFVKVKKEASLTTGKPVRSSSDQLDPRLAKLVVDGEIMNEDYWSDKVNGWIIIDLQREETIDKVKVYTYWDNSRYYQYLIEFSDDGIHWKKAVDYSHNTTVAQADGYIHYLNHLATRYIKITMLYNSANSLMHLLEINAFGNNN
jgi:hypothetical protein